jgi:superfamily II DNA helicase RecQ
MDRAPDILKYARLFYICPEFLDKDKDKYKILEKLFTEQRVSRIVVDEAHQALVGSFY